MTARQCRHYMSVKSGALPMCRPTWRCVDVQYDVGLVLLLPLPLRFCASGAAFFATAASATADMVAGV